MYIAALILQLGRERGFTSATPSSRLDDAHGQITLAGRDALSRWLDAADRG